MVGEGLTDIVIGDMETGDLPSVLEIERASFAMPWSETSFFNELKNPRSISRAAKRDGRVTGYIFASRILDEGHILDLAVHPDFRRQGIASALVAHVIEHLREEGCRFLYLEVRESNVPAIKMYGKFGFERIGIRKKYYVSPDEDAVIMCLKLEE
ncbi:MAG: ribosomal protein S18-alanine N-acetyltransferase [Nitrospiraceae bacterium]|nr:ribosomal protein S18-alanine N-acetyltransferase [Nitrospiraceae bacterium]